MQEVELKAILEKMAELIFHVAPQDSGTRTEAFALQEQIASAFDDEKPIVHSKKK